MADRSSAASSEEARAGARALPSIAAVLARIEERGVRFPVALLTREVRREVDHARSLALRGGATPSPAAIADRVCARIERLASPSLVNLINATGVVLHTNLGRAPLGVWQPVTGYSNLEYDLGAGRRGKRDAHTSALLRELLDRPAIAVNNGAAATLLALNEIARGQEVIVSRGELIEIGDGFRILEILASSGAILREVGATNRTRIEDYREAISDRTRLILRVHPGNFHMTGFTAKPRLEELSELARERDLPLYEDLGSGNIVDLRPFGIREPLVQDSLRAGVHLVSFSGDKLLGGPQAGILAGDAELIERLRRNPLYRALRLDKLVVQALETTLRSLLFEQWDGIPALRMIRMTADEIGERARRLFPDYETMDGESLIGGGSTPDQSIPTVLVVAARTRVNETEARLRRAATPVIARVSEDRLLIDLRTVMESEEKELVRAVDYARS